MSDHPKSPITADTDVSLDFLTKEAKEALLSKKLDMIRQKNKVLTERHQLFSCRPVKLSPPNELNSYFELIEADRKKAEESGQAVKLAVDSQLCPAEGAVKSRGRGRGHTGQKEPAKYGKEQPKSSVDFRDSSNYEPIVDTSDLVNYKHDHKGKGRGSHHFDNQFATAKNNKRKPGVKEEPKVGCSHKDAVTMYSRGEGKYFKTDARQNKTECISKREAAALDMTSAPENNFLGNSKVYKGRLKDNEGPPPDPSFNPLADRRRSDKKEESAEPRRHPRNYGGNADLNRVKQTMKNMREKEKERPTVNKPLEMVMTGKERRNHEEWKAERERYDQERIQRSTNSGGSWKRAWDADKANQDSDDGSSSASRLEPGKRPAGRIGSGRFDRGERDERPRSAIISKGNLHLVDHASPPQNHKSQPHEPSQNLRSQPQESVNGSDNKSQRHWGKGRGRGRGHGLSSGEKSPRPRTWSGGDDRFVECQKELLVVKFDNTAGDNSVEVEYDDDDFLPSQAAIKSAPHTTAGRNQNDISQTAGKPKQGKLSHRLKDGGHQSVPEQDRSHAKSQVPLVNDGSQLSVPEQDRSHAKSQVPVVNSNVERTSSQSHSVGDSEDWEDCTESSGAHDESEQDLHLECRLNPDAPEFLPTSPDFMKTPPGHVKVLNWASDAGPTSPLSQPSVSKLATTDSDSPVTSSCSSYRKCFHQMEEEDLLPESDEPFVPCDISIPTDGLHEEEEEKFEDSLESALGLTEMQDKELIMPSSQEITNKTSSSLKPDQLTSSTETNDKSFKTKIEKGIENNTVEEIVLQDIQSVESDHPAGLVKSTELNNTNILNSVVSVDTALETIPDCDGQCTEVIINVASESTNCAPDLSAAGSVFTT